MTSSSCLLPATRRALTRRIAVGQAEGRTPSLVGAVARDGGQAWCGARSMLEGHEPDGGTQYRIGSLTKTFIAVLVMRLRSGAPVTCAPGSETSSGRRRTRPGARSTIPTPDTVCSARWPASC